MEQKPKTLQDLSLTELQAEDWKRERQIEAIQQERQIINQEINKRAQEETKVDLPEVIEEEKKD